MNNGLSRQVCDAEAPILHMRMTINRKLIDVNVQVNNSAQVSRCPGSTRHSTNPAENGAIHAIQLNPETRQNCPLMAEAVPD
jgi:hypothetical protein